MSFMAIPIFVFDGQASWLEALAQADTQLGIPAAYMAGSLSQEQVISQATVMAAFG
jgi:hypothetical protein